MSPITVVARIKAAQDSVETVKNELCRMVEPTRKENGCLEYRLHQDNGDPSVFFFYEMWENTAALERHKETDHYRHYAATVFGLLEDRIVNKLTRIA